MLVRLCRRKVATLLYVQWGWVVPSPRFLRTVGVAESHPRVKAYVKNQGLGFEVPYRYGSNMRKYHPDFIVSIDDGKADLLNLIVEVKGYRGEDAKEKKATMDTYWIPGVNHLGGHGRWAFVELKDVFAMQAEFAANILSYTETHGDYTETHGEKKRPNVPDDLFYHVTWVRSMLKIEERLLEGFTSQSDKRGTPRRRGAAGTCRIDL